MSNLTVSAGIENILKTLGYSPSEQATSYENASINEYENTFILHSPSGEQDEAGRDLDNGFYDTQTWKIMFAFSKSAQNDRVNLGEIHAAKDAIIKSIDNPANWMSFARFLKYKSWTLEETPSYYLLTVTLSVTDTYTY